VPGIEQARAHVLAKQGLAGPRLDTVLDAISATAGIYSTAPTCYLSSAARVHGFRLADLDAVLFQRRSAVRVRCMRGGMAYIEPLDLLPALFACTGEAKDRTLTRVGKWTGLGEDGALALAGRIETAMAGQPPVTVPEIRKLLGEDPPGTKEALAMVVALLGRFGRIVRSEVRGGWRSDNYAYALWRDWAGDPVPDIDPAEARSELARRYLRAFGPATLEDLKWWTGWTKRDTLPALATLAEAGEIVEVAGCRWLIADELDALTGTGPAESIRLLPVWDAYFMGYAPGGGGTPGGRARQITAADYPKVYDRAGNGTSTVTQDGLAAGVWQLDADAGTVTVAPFGDLRWDEVEAEVLALGTSIGTELRLERAPAARPLSEGPRNAFLSPISLMNT
jgi:hypothetical protein